MLEHANAGNTIKSAFRITIVLQPDLHFVQQSGACNALLRQFELVLRQRLWAPLSSPSVHAGRNQPVDRSITPPAAAMWSGHECYPPSYRASFPKSRCTSEKELTERSSETTSRLSEALRDPKAGRVTANKGVTAEVAAVASCRRPARYTRCDHAGGKGGPARIPGNPVPV